jgi:hypothetical protein
VARHFPIPLDHGYFRRLLQAWHEGSARIVAIPYSYEVPPVSAAGLAKVMSRVFESAVDIAWRPAIPYGEDSVPDMDVPALTGVVIVFNLSATPERENHGAFVAALRTACAGLAPLIALVDTSDFVARFGDQPRRIAERETAWQQLLGAQGVDALSVRLAEPDVASAAAAFATRLEQVMQ